MPGSPGSTPNAIAGKVSVIKLIHKIWTGAKILQPISVITNKVKTSPKLADNKY